MITIVNYGLGNLGSIVNMFKRIGVASKVSNHLEEIERAEKLLLPGVGAFDIAMTMINEKGMMEVLNKKALVDQIPVLGICLGMQLLTRSSEEGKLPGLGWIEADTRRFAIGNGLNVPHMGWNKVIPSTPSLLTCNLPDEARFYFVHSYHVHVDDERNSILKCNYGISFDAAIQRDNIYGAQFHPEKSHRFGMQLLKNFAEI